MNEWMNEWMDGWMDGWMSTWLNKGRAVYQLMRQTVKKGFESKNKWMNKRWNSEWISQWIRKRASHWTDVNGWSDEYREGRMPAKYPNIVSLSFDFRRVNNYPPKWRWIVFLYVLSQWIASTHEFFSPENRGKTRAQNPEKYREMNSRYYPEFE